MNIERRAKALVIMEWMFFVLGIVVLAIALDVLSEDIRDTFSSPEEFPLAVITATLLCFGIAIVFLMNILLTKGVKKNDSTSCKIWSVINAIFIFIYTLNLAAIAFVTMGINRAFLLVVVGGGGILLYRIWALKTILTFNGTDFSLEIFEMRKKFKKLH